MSRKYQDNYYSFHTAIGAQFNAFILKEFKGRPDWDDLQYLYKKFLKTKMGTAHQRVTLVFIAAKLFGVDTEKYHDEIMKLAAAPELLIWSEYAFNWAIDGKNNISGTKYEENIDLITSQYLLTEVTNFLPDRMMKRYLEIYRWEVFGCLTVDRDLCLTNWNKLRKWEDFWNVYSNKHIFPDVGYLYAYCLEIVREYFQIPVEQEVIDKLFRIGCELGRGVQINGDLSDFMIPNNLISTTEKRPDKDYFIDIRTNRLTYPTWLLLDYSEKNDPELFAELIKSAEDRAYPNEQFYFKVHDCLQQQEMIQKILAFLRAEQERLTLEIKALPLNQAGIDLLLGAIEILTHNKFQRQIEKDFQIEY